MGGVDIIAAVFTDRGDSLLPFDVRDSTFRHRVTPEGDDRDLMNQMLAHHHQRRHFAAAVAQEPVV